MRMPNVYTPYEMKEWPNYEQIRDDMWRPCRPLGWGFTFRRNLYVAWMVFLGRWDALNWNGTQGYDRRNGRAMTGTIKAHLSGQCWCGEAHPLITMVTGAPPIASGAIYNGQFDAAREDSQP